MHTDKKANNMILPAHRQTASDLNWLIKGLHSDGKESLSYIMACLLSSLELYLCHHHSSFHLNPLRLPTVFGIARGDNHCMDPSQ